MSISYPGPDRPDPVKPDHYHGDYVMRVIEEFGLDFCKGNACKYLLRAGHKDGALEQDDLRKAIWYLERRIANLEKSGCGGRGEGPGNDAESYKGRRTKRRTGD